MTYTDSLSLATQRALDWDDLPQDLLPLVIVSEAAQLSALDSDALGCTHLHRTQPRPCPVAFLHPPLMACGR